MLRCPEAGLGSNYFGFPDTMPRAPIIKRNPTQLCAAALRSVGEIIKRASQVGDRSGSRERVWGYQPVRYRLLRYLETRQAKAMLILTSRVGLKS
jgi:hypothetical protein